MARPKKLPPDPKDVKFKELCDKAIKLLATKFYIGQTTTKEVIEILEKHRKSIP
jgi:hypothetical protein